MEAYKSLLDRTEPDRKIDFRVIPAFRGGFGVYANAVLIAIHECLAEADAHCQRLRLQQVHDT